MDAISNTFGDMWAWLSSSFKKDMPPLQLALFIALFILLAFIVTDAMRVLGKWTAGAYETIA